MATQPANECARDIYENGCAVCILAGASAAIEAVVVCVREELQATLDWHYVGGRAVVLTMDVPERHERIREAIRLAMPVWLGPLS